jgi:hypothetical protein
MGEANPVIFEDFVGELLDRFPEPVVWEPFAGHTGRSASYDFCDDIGIKLIAYDLNPEDFRVQKEDSTKTGPQERIQGVLFHPPYFGTSPMTTNSTDLSNAPDEDAYREAMSKTIALAKESMVAGGLVAAIGRDYRTNGRRIQLPVWFLDMFEGFKLIGVWSSEPDIVLIFER